MYGLKKYDTKPDHMVADTEALWCDVGMGRVEKLAWSGKFPLPEIGDIIVITGIGRAKVTGYASEGPWLGVMASPRNPPDWMARGQGHPQEPVLAYGAECKEVPK